MKISAKAYSDFFDSKKDQLYTLNIKTIRSLSTFYLLSILLSSLLAIQAFADVQSMLTGLIITYVITLLLIVIIYLSCRYIEKNQITNLTLSKLLTYLTMFVTMSFIIIVNIFVSKAHVRPAYFFLFSVILPSFYFLRKREILIVQFLSVTVFMILSYFFRGSSFSDDLYLSVSSLVIGIPYNFVSYNIKMHDEYVKNFFLEEANLDSLSKLPNRRAYNTKIEKIFKNKECNNLLLAVIDIDDFKQINDTLGHAKGDEVIQKIGIVLKKFSNEYQVFISRIGGDEFTLIGLNFAKAKIKKVLDDLVDVLKTVEVTEEKYFGVSIGAIYTTNPYYYNSEELYIKADDALYSIKNNHKDDIKIIFD